jgi:hypothetical protein
VAPGGGGLNFGANIRYALQTNGKWYIQKFGNSTLHLDVFYQLTGGTNAEPCCVTDCNFLMRLSQLGNAITAPSQYEEKKPGEKIFIKIPKFE